MPIQVTCACGKVYRFKDEFAGRRAKCPACGAMVAIPYAPRQHISRCQRCGAEIEHGEKRCPQCALRFWRKMVRVGIAGALLAASLIVLAVIFIPRMLLKYEFTHEAPGVYQALLPLLLKNPSPSLVGEAGELGTGILVLELSPTGALEDYERYWRPSPKSRWCCAYDSKDTMRWHEGDLTNAHLRNLLDGLTTIVVWRKLSSRNVGTYVYRNRGGVAGAAEETDLGVHIISWPQREVRGYRVFVGKPPLTTGRGAVNGVVDDGYYGAIETARAWFRCPKQSAPRFPAAKAPSTAYPAPAEPVYMTLALSGGVTMKMVLIRPGKLTGDAEHPINYTQIISEHYMGVTEVTQAQYEAIMGTNPSQFKDPTNPVEGVSLDDATEFCKRMSEKTGKEVRLPWTAEWEYACRAGTQTVFSFGDDESELGEYAWYLGNSDGRTHAVGQKKPNSWGLYDMHGNVLEWCATSWTQTYGFGASMQCYSVRGGSFSDGDADVFLCAHSSGYGSACRCENLGFRCAMTLP